MNLTNDKKIQIANKLYLSWLTAVGVCGLSLFIISAAITIHDSIIASRAFREIKPYLPSVLIDPSGNTYANLFAMEHYINSPDVDVSAVSEKLRYFGFRVYKGYSKHEVSIQSLWGSPATTDISTISNAFLFLFSAIGIMLVSMLIKKWLVWLVR